MVVLYCEGGLGGGGDGDSYCDSEASLDGSCYDQLEDPLSPPPDVPQTLDLRHAHHEVSSPNNFMKKRELKKKNWVQSRGAIAVSS